jgi:hypothetical protein
MTKVRSDAMSTGLFGDVKPRSVMEALLESAFS